MFLFASCSNDDASLDSGNQNKEAKYDVSLLVKKPSLTVEENPQTKDLRGQEIDMFNNLRVIVYDKTTGAYHSRKDILSEELQSILTEDNEIPITLELPKGDYTVAIFMNKEKDFTKWLVPTNFNTDYLGGDPISSDGSLLKPTTNQHHYYESTNISVSPNSTTEVGAISLKPMWADVRIYFNDMDKTVFPEEATDIRLIYKNHYYGFNLKNKLAEKISPSITGEKEYPGYYIYNIVPLPKDQQYHHIYVAESANNVIEFSLEFVKQTGDYTWEVVKTIDYSLDNTVKVKNGFKYDVFGKIADSSNSQSLGLSVIDFDSNTIEVPFN